MSMWFSQCSTFAHVVFLVAMQEAAKPAPAASNGTAAPAAANGAAADKAAPAAAKAPIPDHLASFLPSEPSASKRSSGGGASGGGKGKKGKGKGKK